MSFFYGNTENAVILIWFFFLTDSFSIMNCLIDLLNLLELKDWIRIDFWIVWFIVQEFELQNPK